MLALKAWRDNARYLHVNGRKVAYWESDKGAQKPILLLIHGYPTSSWDWTAIWPAIEKHFHLVALDMLGFGLSDKPREHHYSIMEQADLQEELARQVGFGQAHILTHDYGNTVGQELLARALENSLGFNISSMCFLNGGLFPEQHRARLIQKLGLTPLGPLLGKIMSPERLRKSFDGIFGPQTKPSATEIDGHWELISENNGQSVLHRLLNYIPERRNNRERWVGALKQTAVPLRLINGGFDPVSGEHLYHYYNKQVPNPDSVLLENIGHYPHTEAAEKVTSHFLAFHGH